MVALDAPPQRGIGERWFGHEVDVAFEQGGKCPQKTLSPGGRGRGRVRSMGRVRGLVPLCGEGRIETPHPPIAAVGEAKLRLPRIAKASFAIEAMGPSLSRKGRGLANG